MKQYLRNASKLFSMVLLASSVIWLGSCGEDEDPVTENIWQIVEGNADLSTIKEELMRYGLDDVLATDGVDYTFFAPSNQALEDLLATLGLDDFSPVRDDIAEEVLKFHVLASKVLAKDVVEGAEFSTLSANPADKITVIAGPKLESGATTPASIVDSDIKATNGTVHVIDKALVPPSIGALIVKYLTTVGQPIFLGKDFSTIADAILKADVYANDNTLPTIESVLLSDGPITVFAPVNAVLALGGITVDSFTGQQWYGLIMNHLAAGNYGPGGTQTNFAAAQKITTFAQLELTVLTTDAPTDPGNGITSGVAIDANGDATAEAQIAVENAAIAGNGTVHALAGVLNPN